MKKKFLLFFLLLLSLEYSYSQTSKTKFTNLNSVLHELKNDSELKNATISIYAKDINSNEIIAELNGDLSMKPASTMKLFTSATALEVLGANYKFKTAIAYTGEIDTISKTLHGNILIIGGGDPTLGSKYFSSTNKKQFLYKWTKAIKELGIDFIDGNIISDARKYSRDMIPPTWSWEDIGNYFGAGACGLTVFDNMYTLYYNTSSTVGGKTFITKIEPEIPGLKIENTVTAANINSDLSYIFGVPYTYNRYIRGELPRGRTAYKVKGSMPDPALFVAQELKNNLLREGIKITGDAFTLRILNDTVDVSKFKVITVVKSPKLSEIIKLLNTKSINLFAEHLLLESSIKIAGVNDTKNAANVVESFWANKGMNTKGLSINDGSGLSYYNYVSTKQLVFVLDYMHDKSKYYKQFYSSLPVTGESGTLKRVCLNTAAHGKVHAKSGSIRKVRCYSGYTVSASGREIAFAMMLNNFNCSDSNARKKLEKIMIALVQINE